ncbi:MAG: acyltransferase domain-containing protein [Christensenellales bacterium]
MSAWDGIFTPSPAFRKAFDAAELNFDLHALCFDGPQETLNQTQYTQPCMVAFACGVTALFDAGIRPDYVAGLSLGEYSALEASGVFAAKSAIELAAIAARR